MHRATRATRLGGTQRRHFRDRCAAHRRGLRPGSGRRTQPAVPGEHPAKPRGSVLRPATEAARPDHDQRSADIGGVVGERAIPLRHQLRRIESRCDRSGQLDYSSPRQSTGRSGGRSRGRRRSCPDHYRGYRIECEQPVALRSELHNRRSIEPDRRAAGARPAADRAAFGPGLYVFAQPIEDVAEWTLHHWTEQPQRHHAAGVRL